MLKLFSAYVILMLSGIQIVAQTSKKRLPQIINVPTYSHIFPSLSGDGNHMIYLTNYTNSEGFETRYTYRIGHNTWADPVPIPSINRPGLDHIGSFCLSYDGNFVAFSSRRSPGIGNYDIWISERVGNNWSAPVNPGKPLNSSGHEGNPSLSPDGKSMYFMRCESMDATKKRNCSIFVSRKLSPTKWSEPEALPDHINNSHETTPRIMADNKTLIFSSARLAGKGMMDLYTSTFEHSSWSKVKALDFINTDQNDEFVSVPARGDIMYYSGSYKNVLNIYMAAIPNDLRPNKVLMLTGKITVQQNENPAKEVLIQAYDATTGDLYTTVMPRMSDNTYTLFLPEGTTYDVSAFPLAAGSTYQSMMIDLTSMTQSRKEDLDFNLGSLQQGTTIPLSTIRFDDYTTDLSTASDIELKRIIGLLKKNRNTRIEIGAYIDSVYTDSIPSNDLTEIIIDTTFFELPIEEKVALMATEVEDSIHQSKQLDHDVDSLEALAQDSVAVVDQVAYQAQDELPVISQQDSLLLEGYVILSRTEEKETFYKVDYTYHNDRTKKQADALKNKLIDLGVPAALLESKGYGANWTIDRAEEERNYWIELKIIGD